MRYELLNQRQQSDYERIEQAIGFLERNFQSQPTLQDAARSVHLSEYHFQRLFRRWAGISPKRFVEFLTVEHAKNLLAESRSVLQASLDCGLSGPGRLHDLFVNIEAVSPGDFKSRGAGLKIGYGVHQTPFGACLLATTERGICGLDFVDLRRVRSAIGQLRIRWPKAEFAEARSDTRMIAEQIFGRERRSRPITLLLQGTNFQIKVWQALLRIPPGHVLSYKDIAQRVCGASASRAVGGAVGANPIAYLIPCHRVINSLGALGSYKWGSKRKKALLAWEAARKS